MTEEIKHINEKNQEYIAEGNRMVKEIIINGINVAGCCYYESKNDTGKWCDLTCTRDNAPVFRCEKMPNCYYKQLKRLEQENKALKDNNNHLQVIIDDGRAENKRFREENKELKDEIEAFKTMATVPTRMYNECERERCRYGSALEEIRKECKCYGRQRGSNREFDREYGGELHINIIEQINEVLNDSER